MTEIPVNFGEVQAAFCNGRVARMIPKMKDGPSDATIDKTRRVSMAVMLLVADAALCYGLVMVGGGHRNFMAIGAIGSVVYLIVEPWTRKINENVTDQAVLRARPSFLPKTIAKWWLSITRSGTPADRAAKESDLLSRSWCPRTVLQYSAYKKDAAVALVVAKALLTLAFCAILPFAYVRSIASGYFLTVICARWIIECGEVCVAKPLPAGAG